MHDGSGSDRKGIFAGEDPVALVRDWVEAARKTEPSDPDAVALATVDAEGLPNVRMVLLREIEADAFVFYTNYESVKGREISESGKAAFVLHWKSLKRQVRVRGIAEREDGAQADRYYQGRALQSRIGAWASRQSQPLPSRASLMADVAKASLTHGTSPQRPPFWGGFRIRPVEIELWADGSFRLHDRFRFARPDPADSWTVTRLNP